MSLQLSWKQKKIWPVVKDIQFYCFLVWHLFSYLKKFMYTILFMGYVNLFKACCYPYRYTYLAEMYTHETVVVTLKFYVFQDYLFCTLFTQVLLKMKFQVCGLYYMGILDLNSCIMRLPTGSYLSCDIQVLMVKFLECFLGKSGT
jgi:hypothetical protein